jgi:hypothetical protein
MIMGNAMPKAHAWREAEYHDCDGAGSGSGGQESGSIGTETPGTCGIYGSTSPYCNQDDQAIRWNENTLSDCLNAASTMENNYFSGIVVWKGDQVRKFGPDCQCEKEIVECYEDGNCSWRCKAG